MAPAVHPLVVRAREALSRGDVRAVELATEERLKTAGRDVHALELRAAVQQRRGQFGQAARTLDTVIGIDPRADWAYNELVRLLIAHEKHAEATQVARSALRAHPDNAEANYFLGLLLARDDQLAASERHLRRAATLLDAPEQKAPPRAKRAAEGSRADERAREAAAEAARPLLERRHDGVLAAVLRALARNLSLQGRLDEADAVHSRAFNLDPLDVETLLDWADTQAARGDLPGAHELLDRAASRSDPEIVWHRRAQLLAQAEDLTAAFNLLLREPLDGEQQLTRGRIRQRLGEHAAAWQDFTRGQSALLKAHPGTEYRAEAVDGLVARCKALAMREGVPSPKLSSTRRDVAQPVFILGFPGAGAGLVERLLGAHPQIRCGGALPFVGELSRLASRLVPGDERYPELLYALGTADQAHLPAVLRDYYLARAEACELTSGAYFTDTMPFNEVYLPLIRVAFPQARIIRVVRHPLDVCVATFSRRMRPTLRCHYRAEDIAHHLAALTELLEHYGALSSDSLTQVRYESLVANPEAEMRRLFEYLELPFEPLALEATLRPSRTATSRSWSFPEPLYDRSVGRHRDYLENLGPGVVARLQKTMALDGYG